MQPRNEKGLTVMQEGITTLELGWLYYFPFEDPPLLPHVCSWLKLAPLENILDVLERAASEGHPRPRQWIFGELRKIAARKSTKAIYG